MAQIGSSIREDRVWGDRTKHWYGKFVTMSLQHQSYPFVRKEVLRVLELKQRMKKVLQLSSEETVLEPQF